MPASTTIPDLRCYEELVAAQPAEFAWPELDERSAATLCYTSGTTGNPKGVLYSHRSTLLHAYAAALHFQPEDRRGAVVLTAVLHQLDQITEARRARLVVASGIVPGVIWLVLFGQMFAVFGCLAVVLAIVGVYGVLSYGVSQRTQEFGVRMALGAEPRDVRAMMLRQGLALALWGIVLGVIGAFGITRIIGSLLYDVAPTDPLSFSAVSIVMLVVSAIAAYLPARRATMVDPVTALRAE